jgi:5'-3' exonuclease
VLLIDGDIFCYRVGFSCNSEAEEVCINTLDSYLSDIIMKFDVQPYTVVITGKGNFRNEIAVTAPYKGNRKKDKPIHYAAIRERMKVYWGALETSGIEADDLISILATENTNSVIISIDKDFDQVPGKHFNFVKNLHYVIEEKEGLLNFYMQMLVGDRIDNIIGADGIGPVKARKLLEDKTELEMYNACVDVLGADRVLENGRLLWLQREEGQMWNPPVEYYHA